MDGIVITHPGLEAVSGKEVKELIGADCTIEPSVAQFKAAKLEDFCTLCYRSQSAIKVVNLLLSGRVKSIEEVLPHIGNLDLAEWLKGSKFVVRSMIIDNDDVDTMESERLIGEVIHEKYNAKVDLENPDVTFCMYVFRDRFYFGVDFAGFDLSKRNYRIFALSDAVKATAAYALVRLGGYKKGMTMLDPFTHSGTVSIEAALFATKKPVNYYGKDRFAFLNFPQFKGIDFTKFFEKHDRFDDDLKGITASDSQQRHVRAAEKNAKIAGLNKQINFTRMDIEWLDTKFEKLSVDRIITNPPKASRLLTEKGIEKMYQELFYTADFILKPDGRIVLLAKNYIQILKHAQRYHFELKGSFKFMQGKEEFSILVFEKEKK
jgi:23S rRNA G2445 N2-methylase RlmL